nr:hypothetical protein [Tanacetum cinerariifolium]
MAAATPTNHCRCRTKIRGRLFAVAAAWGGCGCHTAAKGCRTAAIRTEVFVWLPRQQRREVFVWCCRGKQLHRGCLFGATEAGSGIGGCLFGAAEAGSEHRGCLFGAAEAGSSIGGVCLVLPSTRGAFGFGLALGEHLVVMVSTKVSWTNICHQNRVFEFHVDESELHPSYDFFAFGPLPGYAGNMNNNEWIKADVPLFGELCVVADKLMVGPIVDEIAEPIEVNEEWLMAPVTPLLMPAVPSPSVYKIGGPSTGAAEGPSFPYVAPRLRVPLSVIKDLSTRLGNLEYGHEQLVQNVI